MAQKKLLEQCSAGRERRLLQTQCGVPTSQAYFSFPPILAKSKRFDAQEEEKEKKAPRFPRNTVTQKLLFLFGKAKPTLERGDSSEYMEKKRKKEEEARWGNCLLGILFILFFFSEGEVFSFLSFSCSKWAEIERRYFSFRHRV